jgi:hypothetical protein
MKPRSERNVSEKELVFLVCRPLPLVFEPHLISLKIFYQILCFVGINRFTVYIIQPLPCPCLFQLLSACVAGVCARTEGELATLIFL